MREKVGSHECTITVTTHANSATVCHAHSDRFVDGCFRRSNDLFDEGIVHGFRIANNRHGCIVHDRIALSQQSQMTKARDARELGWIGRHLSGCARVIKFQRVSPHNQWQASPFNIVGGQIKRCRQRYSVTSLVFDDLLFDAANLRGWVLEVGQSNVGPSG